MKSKPIEADEGAANHEDDCPYNYGLLCSCLGKTAPRIEADKELDEILDDFRLFHDVTCIDDVAEQTEKTTARLLAWRDKEVKAGMLRQRAFDQKLIDKAVVAAVDKAVEVAKDWVEKNAAQLFIKRYSKRLNKLAPKYNVGDTENEL